MELVKQYEITRIEEGQIRAVQDTLIVEHGMELYVNGKLSARFLCTPDHLQELVYGSLFAQGLIGGCGDVQSLTITGSRAEAVVQNGKTSARREECGKSRQKITFQVQELFEAMEWLGEQSSLFSLTGGVHSCALWHADGRRIFMEDIGRHNAVDKALGRALLENWDLAQCLLLTSGRIPGELITKALHTGVQVIVSRSAPMASAVDLARRHHLTLCGFVRGRRMNIYSAPERILP